MCYSLWYNAPNDVAGQWPATSWVHFTTSCNTQSSAPEDGQNNCPKLVELTGLNIGGSVHHAFVVKIIPTRSNNCVLFFTNAFTLHVSGDNPTHHQEYMCFIWRQVSRHTVN